jgi:hypothetical protein
MTADGGTLSKPQPPIANIVGSVGFPFQQHMLIEPLRFSIADYYCMAR